MFVGPIFIREALILPRQFKHFLIRSGYVAALIVLMFTASQAAFGWQQVRNIGDVARFGSLIFQVFSLVQLSLVIFFALLFSAGNVAQEKDRQTLILLLMTDLRDREMVLGKLFSSLLLVVVLLAASIPVFIFVQLMGGVSTKQIGWSLAICASSALAAGSWGSLVAYWRDKTFQTLAISVLGVVLFFGVVEAVIHFTGASVIATWMAVLNPYRAMIGILDPLHEVTHSVAVNVSAQDTAIAMIMLFVVLNGYAIFRLRVWNPSRATFLTAAARKDDGTSTAKAISRNIWHNPVIWREICTRAYGRKIFVIKLAYFSLAAFAVTYFQHSREMSELVLGMISPVGLAFVGLALLSLILVNAQAVTALTTERDGKTLDLLLATDVTAKEFVYGKLGGVFYNTKELILIPLVLLVYYVFAGVIGGENCVYVVISFLILVVFCTMLGLHSGLSFDSSRSAIANSLGTMFFLFIGIFIFMMLLIEARSSFFLQFQSFIVFIGAGSIALYTSLTHKNPSGALTISAGVLPFLTFYAITQFLLEGTLGVCLAIAVAYGFTTLAMLVPAVSEFDVALGRTTLDKG